MKMRKLKLTISVIALYSITLAAPLKAAPLQFKQVVQIVNAKPGSADTGNFAALRLNEATTTSNGDEGGDDDKKKAAPAPQQDTRVISETRTEIVEDDVCDCVSPQIVTAGFPYGWLALGAAPLAFLIPRGDDNPPDSVVVVPPTSTPTPVVTPTPTPEPMTILLFGTGLAGVGFTARRRFGKTEKSRKV